VNWHRRKLAVLAALAAVLTGFAAFADDGPPLLTVVRAAGELPGGTLLDSSDLELDRVVARDAPEGAVPAVEDLVGRRLAAPVADGQILTPLALAAAAASLGQGHVVAPLRLADADLAALLRAGDVVDVVAADEQAADAIVVARSVRVVSVPQPTEGAEPATGALVLLEVTPGIARTLAQAATADSLTVIWR
jgi:Flp pilus assembly protein CpaB